MKSEKSNIFEFPFKYGISIETGKKYPIGYAVEINKLKKAQCNFIPANGDKCDFTNLSINNDIVFWLKKQFSVETIFNKKNCFPDLINSTEVYYYNGHMGYHDKYGNDIFKYDEYEDTYYDEYKQKDNSYIYEVKDPNVNKNLRVVTPKEIPKEEFHEFFLKELPESEQTYADELRSLGNSTVSDQTEHSKPDISELLEELDQMIGLEGVKQHIKKLVAYHKINQLREEKGLMCAKISHHLAFEGPPGTGKTTIARLIAKIYHALDIIPTSNLIETDRSGLVGQYIGSSSKKTQEQIKKAQGGVLFIDEAYALSQGHSSGNNKDYGQEVITTLLKAMEDKRDKFIVIFAGYHKEMKEFWNMNSGLKSRVPESNHIIFKPYDQQEILTIAKLIAEENHYQIDTYAEDIVLEQASVAQTKDKFGNGRWARDLVETAILNHSLRLFEEANLSREQLITLRAEDINISEKPQDKTFGFK